MDHVFNTGPRKDASDAALAEIAKNVTAAQSDLANLADIDRLYEAAKKYHRPIDITFANAGVANWRRSEPWMKSFSISTSTQT
jgi:NAD(P)-dependent dehydrogenase (short-subunit alcohol dehydrogenase family)